MKTPDFSMEELDKKMEDFLLEFEDLLEDMTPSQFKARVSGSYLPYA